VVVWPRVRAHIAIRRRRLASRGGEPDLKRALRPVPAYERAVREVSRMFAEARIRHALVGALEANAYRNPHLVGGHEPLR
jgi:hypothetical protein